MEFRRCNWLVRVHGLLQRFHLTFTVRAPRVREAAKSRKEFISGASHCECAR
jgi:hypothetical protein